MAASLAIAECANLAVLVTFCVVKLKIPFRFFWGFESETIRELATSIRLKVDRVPS